MKSGALLQTPQSGKIGVLSIQMSSNGHKTYGGLLRRAFASSETIDFQPYWVDEKRELYARAIYQVLSLRIPLQWVAERNADVFRLRSDLGYGLFGRRLAQRMSLNFRTDVIHFHTQVPALLSTDIIKHTPTVITLDQTATQIALETDRSWRWTHAASIEMERAALHHAAAVAPWSRWAAKSLIDEHGVAPERVHVIPPGIELSDFAGIDRERRYSGPERPLRILFVGGDFQRKGGPLLVDVFIERFAQRGVELHLVTAATGIVDHPQVVLHRGVSAFSAEWKRLFTEADIFVLPTRWEAFGIVFVEAMAAGLPVIGTSISAIPEIVTQGETGFLIAKDDRNALAQRLEVLLTNPTLRRRLGENGVRRVATLFDGARNAAKLEELFQSVSHELTSVAS